MGRFSTDANSWTSLNKACMHERTAHLREESAHLRVEPLCIQLRYRKVSASPTRDRLDSRATQTPLTGPTGTKGAVYVSMCASACLAATCVSCAYIRAVLLRLRWVCSRRLTAEISDISPHCPVRLTASIPTQVSLEAASILPSPIGQSCGFG